ncbi:MAG: pectinesterase family protein [Actinomycetota bacterium]|nr:pectinesterase family protein [Actinomycetota bacterium]
MRRRTFLGASAGAATVASLFGGRAVSASAGSANDLSGASGVGGATVNNTGGDGAGAGGGGGSGRRVVVASDGSGDFAGIQEAVDAVPAGNSAPFVIAVRPGTYTGRVVIPADRPLITMVGLGRRPADVVIADDRANGTPNPDGGTWGTTGSASVTVDGRDFRAHNVTFANLFDEAAHPEITSRQAVAVLTRADRVAFTRVRFLGNQDTLYANSSAAGTVARAYFRDCYVEGDVDFIFGRATAVFDRCRIHSLDRESMPRGYVTAPSTDIANPYGFLFARCAFTSDAPEASVFLGRPWHPSQDPNAIGQTIIRDSRIDAHIGATAWSDFGTWPWQEARFAEYRNHGRGARPSPDRPQLTPVEAATRTVPAFLRGADKWSPDRHL